MTQNIFDDLPFSTLNCPNYVKKYNLDIFSIDFLILISEWGFEILAWVFTDSITFDFFILYKLEVNKSASKIMWEK